MISLVNKQECCGCSACVQKCPTQCISLQEDVEGFLYPQVNTTECIDCNLCEKVCPWLNRNASISPLKVLAVKNRNEEERLRSSSGGVFIALARTVLQKGGVVFGAVFDECWEVKHSYAETFDDVKPMLGSKYLQSRIEQSYLEAETFLKQGREVLFSGSPCQIAGLHTYLKKGYSNLLAVDFLCHGVPSPGVWRKYLKETFIYSDLKREFDIADISFRNKSSGWKKSSLVVNNKNSLNQKDKTTLLAEIFSVNPFMRGFLSNVYLRPSCYSCKCKNGVSRSDITIADYWGINHLMPDFDDDKGVSLVLLNTTVGKEAFDILPMEVRESSLEDARCLNGGFEVVLQHPKRKEFFNGFEKGISFSILIQTTLHISLFKRIVRKIKLIVKKIERS